MIILKEITNKNVWDVCKLKVKKDQENFVAWNIESLAEAYATRNEGNNALPLAVYDNEEYLERCLDSIFIHNKFIKELIDKEICEIIILND